MRSISPRLFRRTVLVVAACLLSTTGNCLPRSSAGGAQIASVAASDEPPRHLQGVVVDSRSGRPIARALVQCMGGWLATLSDREGRFSLDLRFTGSSGVANTAAYHAEMAQRMSMSLNARKPGYVTRRFMGARMPVISANGDVELKLTPEAVIEGRISASGDDHPDGVRVTLMMRRIQDGYGQWTQAGSTASNSRGEFRFSSLEAGEYKLGTAVWTDGPPMPMVADKPSSRYAPVYYPAGSAAAAGPSLHVSAGESVEADLHLHAEPFYPVRVPVSAPSENAPRVQAQLLRDGAASGMALAYNRNDRSMEGMLPRGVYELALESPGQPAYSGAADITVSGAAVRMPPVLLMPVPSIPVIVHQDLTESPSQSTGRQAAHGGMGYMSNGPLAADMPVQVSLQSEDVSRGILSMNRDAGGANTLSINAAMPGTYRLNAWAAQGYVAAATSGGTDLLRHPLVVSAGSGVQPIEITIRNDTSNIAGTLSGDILAGNAASPLFIFCLPVEPSMQRIPQGFVAPGGSTFTVENVAPGSYRVYASHQPAEALEYRSEEVLRRIASKGQPVTLGPGSSASVTLTTILDEEP